ncbi:MAG: 50S ribosomal protein L4 [Dehalococcoidia bacterium]|nr:50S ribosomal protein L4 [Dehalococcoidia bacterium]
MELTIKGIDGKDKGTLQASEAVFGAPLKKAVVYQAMLVQRANQRQGTQSALTRAEVSGGGRKPWNQKGTGRARQGSTRSPQWRHGGVVFAPKPRDYRLSLPKEMRRQALVGLLSEKIRQNQYTIVDDLSLSAAKTAEMAKVLSALGISASCLVVSGQPQDAVVHAAHNLKKVRTLLAANLNVLDLLNHEHVLLTTDAVKRIEELWAERNRRGKVEATA